MPKEKTEEEAKAWLGLTRRRRYKIYAWGSLCLAVGAVIVMILYLRPWRWHTYTDDIKIKQVARDVDPGYVLWEEAESLGESNVSEGFINQTVISSDGARMVYVGRNQDGNDDDLFLRLWDGTKWRQPKPMRALNSKFDETSPTLSGDGNLLLFCSNRPGGQGGQDIWVSKWDGVEYAWPLPLSSSVNTPFDEIDPAITPDSTKLFFSSNRPHPATDISEKKAMEASVAAQLENVDDRKVDFDLFSADVASNELLGLFSERQQSILYSLREGALGDVRVMTKLGGTEQSEKAVDKALAYLVSIQEEDGRWDIQKTGGGGGHDMAATGFSLLALYGRGERHDLPCKYKDNVGRGLRWLIEQQLPNGDLRGKKGNMYDHGIAALAMVEAYGVTKDKNLRSPAQRAIDFIEEAQHEEGGWRYKPKEKGDLSVSGWMIMALASGEMSGIPIPTKTRAGVRRFLKEISGGKDGGSYGYTDSPGGGKGSNAMNAVGFFCSQLMGASSNAARAFESSMILDKSGFDLGDIYYAYYGTLAAYQHQGPAWRKWLGKMQESFVKAQETDGSWTLKGPHTNQMGKGIMTALVTLCMEAHYRYTPLYGLGFEPDPSGPSPDVLEGKDLPRVPVFRKAKHLPLLSSPGTDTAPVITDHGDFLYFTSTRPEGFGGSDLYRSRLRGGEVTAPSNLGEEINGESNETHPAVRMAGFHILFNSDRGGNPHELFQAKSKRVIRRFDYSKSPTSDWYGRNVELLVGLCLTGLLLALAYLRAFRKPRSGDEPDASAVTSKS